MKPCWILTTPRSGSTFLCRKLNQTGLFNPAFAEWYNAETLFHEAFVKSPPIFCKIHRFQYNRHEPLFPKDVFYIHLTRKDLIEATVSQYFAGHTKMWNTTCEDKLSEHANVEVPYNQNDLIRLYLEMQVESKGWIEFLKDKEYLEFDYSDLMDNAGDIVDQIVDICGVQNNEINKYSKMHTPLKMYHPMKDVYVEKFRKFIRNLEELK